jgi:hypothetical protein
MTSITSSASEIQPNYNDGIMPCLEHISNAEFSFSALSDGGHVSVSYDGYNSFVRADVTVKVEKRFLLVFWNDVDEWSASSTNPYGVFYHLFTLNGNGTYRATVTLTITGSDGTVDTITDEIESKLE